MRGAAYFGCNSSSPPTFSKTISSSAFTKYSNYASNLSIFGSKTKEPRRFTFSQRYARSTSRWAIGKKWICATWFSYVISMCEPWTIISTELRIWFTLKTVLCTSTKDEKPFYLSLSINH
jgi:hypothetical protein